MAAEVLIRAVEPADLEHLSAHLRTQDQAELDAAGWLDYHRALEVSVERSRWSQVGLIDGQIACVFGCAEYGSLLAPTGVPWLLGTDVLTRHRRVLQRLARCYIETMLLDYPRLFNAVHAGNTAAVRWLKRLGFTLHPAIAAPPHGAPFHVFEMSRHV